MVEDPAQTNCMRLNPSPAIKRYLTTALRWTGRGLFILFLLILAVAIALQLPPVQTWLTGQLARMASERTGAPITVGRVALRLPASISLERIYAEDLQGDTLLYAGRLEADVRVLALLRNRVHLRRLSLEDARFSMTRLYPDTLFNTDRIIMALAGEVAAADQPADAMDDPGERSPEEETPGEQAADWEFDIGSILLRNVSFRFADHFAGIDLRLGIGRIDLPIELLDPAGMRFGLGDVAILDGTIDLALDEPSREPAVRPDEPPPETPRIFLGSLRLGNLGFHYAEAGNRVLDLWLEELLLNPRDLDIDRLDFALHSLVVDGLVADLYTGGGQRESPLQEEIAPTGDGEFNLEGIIPVTVWAGQLRLNQASVSMNRNKLAGGSGEAFDAESFAFDDVDLWIEDLLLTPDSLRAGLRHFSGRDAGGFSLIELSAGIALGREALVEDLLIETTESRLEGRLHIGAPLLRQNLVPLPHQPLDIRLEGGLLGRDLMVFVPGLQVLFPDPQAPPLMFSARAIGTLEDLWLEEVLIGLPGRLSTGLSANIRGYPELDSLFADIPQWTLQSHPPAMMAYLPDTLRPEGLVFPDTLIGELSFSGTPYDFELDAGLESEVANLLLELQMATRQGEEEPAWEARFQLDAPRPIALLGEEELIRELYADFVISGRGFDPIQMEMEAEGRIDSVWFNEYTYRGLELSGSLSGGEIRSVLEYSDDHLSLIAHTGMKLGEEAPRLSAEWELLHMNARELMLTSDLILVQTNLSADISQLADDFFEGVIRLDNTHVFHEGEVFSLDSLIVEAGMPGEDFSLDVTAPFLELAYHGSISPLGLPGLLAAHLGEYFEMGSPPDGIPVPADQEFTLNGKLSPTPYITELLLPQIETYEAFGFSIDFDGQTSMLSLDLNIPHAEATGWELQQLHLRAASDPGLIEVSLALPSFRAGGMDLSNVELMGELQQDVLEFNLSFDDHRGDAWLDLSGRLRRIDGLTELTLDQHLLVNRQEWVADPANLLRLGPRYLTAHRLNISSNGKEIALHRGDPDNLEEPLEIRLRHIDLGAFDLIGGTPLVSGGLNASADITHLFETPLLSAELTVDALGVEGNKIGDVELWMESKPPAVYHTRVSVSGYGNRLDLEGSLNLAAPASIAMDVRLDQLDLSTLEAFTFEQLSQMQGMLSGELRLDGELSAPGLTGALDFDQVGFHVAFVNAAYRIPDERIIFDRQRIAFSEFTLVDRSGRRASLDGTVNIDQMDDIRFDLMLSSRNFLAMDLPRGQNELFFGRLLIDTDLRMQGPLSQPQIEGRLGLNQGSDFSFIIPPAHPQAIGDEGVVEFIPPADLPFAEFIDRPLEREPMTAAFQNMVVNVNVEVDPLTDVRVFIDEHTGDFLEVRGGGVLTYGVDPGGRISLAGNYEISSGAYQMTFFDFIRRNFDIVSGSNIVWTGDPIDATVDILARYTIRTSAGELMASHAVSDQPGVAYRRTYPFEVMLHMNGELMSPQIRFEIMLPPEHRGAMEGRLQQRLDGLNENESELNKQVFALLTIGSFIREDPFASIAEGPGLTATARSSASRILSQQLNRLSERYVRGIDIQFGVESYEQVVDGEVVGRTELQMEISRDFLDDRLRITAGGNLELEDETRRQLSPADIAGDFSVEYLLTPDGRLIVKGYRERKYQDVFDGELVETGLSLIFKQTYRRFRELFRTRQESPEVPPGDPEYID